MEKISRSQAKQLGLKYYFTGEPCKFGHISKRQVVNCTCCQCTSIKTHQWREKHPEYHHSYNEAYYQENKNVTKYHSERYYTKMWDNQPEVIRNRIRKNSRTYAKTHRDEMSKRGKEWVANNRGIVNATTAKRRTRKLHATPCWSEFHRIREVYIDCQVINTLNRLVGGTEVMVVDHIVPLQGKRVCGLHVDYNLQIITSSHNATKSNKFNTGETYE